MKVKTITCHDVYNVGASLQAYALATYLQSLGHGVEIIDYKPDYLSHHYPLWGLNNPAYDKFGVRLAYNLAKFPGRFKAKYSNRKKEFDIFTEKYLPLTKVRYTSNEDLKNNPPTADVIFAGSDQIWNCLFKNGQDPAFYLEFASDKTVKASYAASFATDDIPDEWKEKVKGWISNLDFVSVRENSGMEILNRLGIEKAVRVLDPVFLPDVASWEKLIPKTDEAEQYVLVYDFDQNPSVKSYVQKYAREHRLKVYSVFQNDYCDKCFIDEGPIGFLKLVYNADFIVSNSFHATAFSLIFNKSFVVFPRLENINARMIDLLKMAGLENCMVTGNLEQTNSEIDYGRVNANLAVEIEKSKEYISGVLESVK